MVYLSSLLNMLGYLCGQKVLFTIYSILINHFHLSGLRFTRQSFIKHDPGKNNNQGKSKNDMYKSRSVKA